MNQGEKSSRIGLHMVGSVMILLGFMTILVVLFAPAWLSFTSSLLGLYAYPVGLLGAIAMIVFGAIISEKARGEAKVRGFMLYGGAIDEVEQVEKKLTKEKLKDDERCN